jgi:hypothetical protein
MENQENQSGPSGQDNVEKNSPQKKVMLFGYDFRDKITNAFLYLLGDPLVRFFTAYQHFANFGLDGRPIEKADVFGTSNVSTLPATVELQPTVEAFPGNDTKPVFLGVAFYKSRRTLLYSASGVGKSLLSIAVGKQFRKCLYILVDNGGGEDLPRYTETLGDKAIIISLKNFQEKGARLEQERDIIAFFEISYIYGVDKEQYKQYLKASNITARICKQLGVNNGDRKPVDNFLVLEEIVIEGIQQWGVDFICIDSLNAVAGDSRRFNREKIRYITRKAAEAHVTLLSLHHTNKRGYISGPGAISEEFDYVYRLSRDASAEGNDDVLVLEEEKARYSKPKKIRIRWTFNNGFTPEYTLLDQTGYTPQEAGTSKEPSLSEKIRRIILEWPEATISFAELKTRIPPSTDGAIKNSLKALEGDNVLKKTNGKWEVITIEK